MDTADRDSRLPPSLVDLCTATLLRTLTGRPSPTGLRKTLTVALVGILNTGKSLYLDLAGCLVQSTRSFEQTPLGHASVSRFVLATDAGPLEIKAIDVPGFLFNSALESLQKSTAEPEIDCLLLVHSAAVQQTLFPVLRAAELLSTHPRKYRIGIVGIAVAERSDVGRPQASGPQGDDALPPDRNVPSGPGIEFACTVELRTKPAVDMLEPLMMAWNHFEPPGVLMGFAGGRTTWTDAVEWLGYSSARELARDMKNEVPELDLVSEGTASPTTPISPRWLGFPGSAPPPPITVEVPSIEELGKYAKKAAAVPTEEVGQSAGFWGSVFARLAGLGQVLSK